MLINSSLILSKYIILRKSLFVIKIVCYFLFYYFFLKKTSKILFSILKTCCCVNFHMHCNNTWTSRIASHACLFKGGKIWDFISSSSVRLLFVFLSMIQFNQNIKVIIGPYIKIQIFLEERRHIRLFVWSTHWEEYFYNLKLIPFKV